MEKFKRIGALLGNVLSVGGWLANLESIVSIICCVAGFMITFVTCVIVPVWKKIRDAKADGKLDPEELDEIAGTLQDGIDQIKKDGK